MLGYCFGYQWEPFNYLVFFSPRNGILGLKPEDAGFYTLLLLAALPFIWVGTVLTERRLRDAGLPLWLVIVFFLPLINLIFFVILAAIPTSQSTEQPSRLSARIGRLIPEGEFGSAVRGLLGKSGKADADQPAIRLAALLARADRRHVQQPGA